MLFYLLINLGALAGQLGMVYAEKNIGEFSGPLSALAVAGTLGVPQQKTLEHRNDGIYPVSNKY
jgi:hypothetical protein